MTLTTRSFIMIFKCDDFCGVLEARDAKEAAMLRGNSEIKFQSRSFTFEGLQDLLEDDGPEVTEVWLRGKK